MPPKIKLCELPLNQSAVVCAVANPETSLTQRIISLGISEGSRITALFQSPFNDPIAYLVKGCVIALRKSDSENILVLPEKQVRA